MWIIAKLNPRRMLGETFGRLTVIKEAPKDKWGHIRYYCSCSCGNANLVIAKKQDLISGMKQSCGCLVRENNNRRKAPFNKYFIDGNDAILFDSKGNICIIDKEDISKLSTHGCWWQNNKGYWVRRDYSDTSKKNGRELQLHCVILGEKDGFIIDHKDTNPSNNRKSNLRYCTVEQNAHNRKLHLKNRSGFTGVKQNKYGKWCASIKTKGINIYLGIYLTKEEAYEARCYAEKILYGKFGHNSNIPTNEEIKEAVENFIEKKGFLSTEDSVNLLNEQY